MTLPAGPDRVAVAEGQGNISVAGNAINSIFVTGGVNQFFVGQYERLRDAYLNPESLFRALELEAFAGRAWLLKAVDDFMVANDRGYILVEAEAGMGKTAFMAWIAKERRYVHHFVRLMADPDDVGSALRSMGAQLIRAWDLEDLAIGGVLPPTASRPDFFADLLVQVARKRDAIRPGEPIVVAVDGLNETHPRAGQNPLALPEDLPPGVYFLVSQRPVHVPLVVRTPRKVCTIRPGSPENLDDMRAYLRQAAERSDVQSSLTVAALTPGDFVERLTASCRGVWLVLRYVLDEIRRGSRRADDLDSLPIGLWQYYAQFWRSWQRDQEEHWSDVDLPLLMTLTAVQEPTTLELLCELGGIADVDRAGELLGDAWRPFLQVTEDMEERYAAFHDSLDEFAAGRVDDTALASSDRSFVKRLAQVHRRAHQRIVDRYLGAWGGLDESVPGLRDGTAMDGGYGFRHIVNHLGRAGADALLHRLLALEWPRDQGAGAGPSSRVNAWYEVHRAQGAFAAYSLDVDRAWRRAEETSLVEGGSGIALEVRYALMTASVNSVAGNVPADLLRLLLEDGQLRPAEVLGLARDAPDPTTRAEALTKVIPRLPAELRDEAMGAALASVQAVPDGYWRAGELARLIPLLDPAHRGAAERIATTMRDGYERRCVLRLLGLPLGSDGERAGRDDPDPSVFVAEYEQRGGQALRTLVAGASLGEGDPVGVDQLVETTRRVGEPRWRAEMLTAVAQRAQPSARGRLLGVALDLSMAIGDHAAGAVALARTAAALAGLGHMTEAHDCLSEISEPARRADALLVLAAAVPPGSRATTVLLSLEATRQIAEPSVAAGVLRRHAALLVAAEGPALDDTLAELGDEWRATVMVALAAHAEVGRRDRLFEAALSVASETSDTDARARLLTELASRVSPTLLRPVARLTTTIDDIELRERVLAELSGRLAEESGPEPATQAIERLTDPTWRMLAQRGSAVAEPTIAPDIAALTWRVATLATGGQTGAAYEVVDATTDPATRATLLLRLARADGSAVGERRPLDEARAALDEVGDPHVRSLLTIARVTALAQAGRAAEAIDESLGIPDDGGRVVGLLAVADHASPDGDVLDATVSAAATIGDACGRARVLARMTSTVVQVRSERVLAHVREVLHLLADGTRAQLLETLPDLLAGVVRLAGPAGLVEVAAAVRGAYRSWP